MEFIFGVQTLRAHGAKLTQANIGIGINPEFAKSRTLFQFPCQRMFASTSSSDEHIALGWTWKRVGFGFAHEYCVPVNLAWNDAGLRIRPTLRGISLATNRLIVIVWV